MTRELVIYGTAWLPETLVMLALESPFFGVFLELRVKRAVPTGEETV
jgi:hypothetical protein